MSQSQCGSENSVQIGASVQLEFCSLTDRQTDRHTDSHTHKHTNFYKNITPLELCGGVKMVIIDNAQGMKQNLLVAIIKSRLYLTASTKFNIKGNR